MPTTFTFDKGPNASWAKRFFQAPRAHYLAHPSQRFRTEFGPVYYRGRLSGTARVLIVGQDPSTDETLAQRNLVGQSGQRVQRLLNKLGVVKSYVMLNTFLFGIKGQMDAQMNAAALEPPIRDYRNGLFDKVIAENAIQAIISFGNGADLAVANWPARPPGVPWFQLHHPSASEAIVVPNWNASLAPLNAAVTPDKPSLVNLAPYTTPLGAGDAVEIPRDDLPFGIPEWHGAGGGTRSQRDGDNVIAWTSPL
jgi:uracil-DNA glycosylase